jgi:glyoxylase-like metal-dependent hydrolase (beta-lactamase superfamily II)/uncharacterized protein with ACT and thioredoxin-like domain
MKDMDMLNSIVPPQVKIYRRLKTSSSKPCADFITKFRVFLEDRPGSLADLASLIAFCGGNISFFHYDRSLDANRVVVEVQMKDKKDISALFNALRDGNYSFEKTVGGREDVQITSAGNILQIKVRLENIPGTLAAFANLLKSHNANVIYMLYDEDIDLESADIAMATKSLKEINYVLDGVNSAGYYYRVLYKGSDEKEVEHIIGLKLVEKFFLKLRKLLPEQEFGELKSIVDSSQEMSEDLVKFYEESGNFLEAGDVFEKIMTLASKSRSRTGRHFTAVEMPPIRINKKVVLYGFRLPTSENIYLFHHDEDITMIDAGYGVYYEDIKKLLRGKSLDPAMVKRIFLTHPDADHAGTSGYFAAEFGTEVFMHQGAKGVIEHKNRAYGLTGRLANLNMYYTRLINQFTGNRFPEKIGYFQLSDSGHEGAFRTIDVFMIGNLEFLVLESHGGHIPGHVFFLNKDYGLIFTSDFLINVRSLSPEDRDVLGVYRYLLTSPNSDGDLYKRESEALSDLITGLNNALKQSGRQAIVFPGHGEYYNVDLLSKPISCKNERQT